MSDNAGARHFPKICGACFLLTWKLFSLTLCCTVTLACQDIYAGLNLVWGVSWPLLSLKSSYNRSVTSENSSLDLLSKVCQWVKHLTFTQLVPCSMLNVCSVSPGQSQNFHTPLSARWKPCLGFCGTACCFSSCSFPPNLAILTINAWVTSQLLWSLGPWAQVLQKL